MSLGRYSEVLEQFPDQRAHCARALLAMGRLEQVVAEYGDQKRQRDMAVRRLGRSEEIGEPQDTDAPWDLLAKAQFAKLLHRYPAYRARALLRMGRYRELVAGCDRPSVDYARALVYLGRAGEAIQRMPGQRNAIARALVTMCRARTALEEYPEQRDAVAGALNCLGRHSDVLREYPDQREECAKALACMGELGRIDKEYTDQGRRVDAGIAMGFAEEIARETHGGAHAQAAVLLALGRTRELIDSSHGWPWARVKALFMEGRAEEVLAAYPDSPPLAARALLSLDRPEEVLQRFDSVAQVGEHLLEATAMLYIRAAARDDRPEAKRLAAAMNDSPFSYGWNRGDVWFPRCLLVPVAERLSGAIDSARYVQELRRLRDSHERRFGQRLFFFVRFLLEEISEQELLDQPWRHRAPARLALAKAIASDVAGDSGAHTLYQAYLRMPMFERGIKPVEDAFARWRGGVWRK